MLAPSGGGLILYQAYGNLYAMTGRKSHLLEDKQISSVGVFDEVLFYTLFQGHLEEIHVTWDHLKKKDYGPTPTLLKNFSTVAGDDITNTTRTLNEAKRNYAPMEKLALSLLHMSQRLRRQAGKYAVELGAYDITYEPLIVEKDETETWILFTNGASNTKGFGAELVLIGPNRMKYTYAPHLNFDRTNNKAEYEVLLAGLKIARKINVLALDVRSFSIRNIPRNQNQKADFLRKLASVAINHLTKEILVEVLNKISTEGKEINSIVEEDGVRWAPTSKLCHPRDRYRGLSNAFRTIIGSGKDMRQGREATTIREARYKTKMEQYYNKKVRPTSFKPGEFVLKKNEASRIGDQGKLGPTWEGPYRVTEAYQNGLLHEKFYNSPDSAPNRCRVV
ncbi:reverse transcriptase domain-containing protein [Tanacetum coccineum]